MHALFDRGFLTIGEHWRVLVSKTHPIPEKLHSLLLPHAVVPQDLALQPHQHFLKFHRDHVFKKDRAA